MYPLLIKTVFYFFLSPDTVIAGVEHCPRSRALFYDRMSQVIYDAKKLDESFLQIITTHFENVLMSDYLVEASKCRSIKFILSFILANLLFTSFCIEIFLV